MRPFNEIHAEDLPHQSVKDQMSTDGYLLIRNLLPVPDLNRLLTSIIRIAEASGWLLPSHNPLDRFANPAAACGDPDPAYKRTLESIFNLEAFHAMAHHPALREVMHSLAGPRLLIHPKPIPRLIFPNCERFIVHAHQDHRSVAGDPETFTVWMPLHDCPVTLGPLQILEGSHYYGLQPVTEATGIIPEDSAYGREWAAGEVKAGDVLIFHSLTVHAATPNVSSQLRISMDCRFQDHTKPVNPANLVFPGSSRNWETTYTGWRSDEFKYFWKNLPLHLSPSKQELAHLIATAESPALRSRYASILQQIKLQIPD